MHSFYSSALPSGENTVVLNEVDALRRAGHDVALLAAHTDELEGEVLYKLRAGLRVATGYGRNPLKAINEFSPDVVHIHNLFPNMGVQWLNELRSPLVHTIHNYRPICANGLLLRAGEACTECITGSSWQGLKYGCYRGSRLATAPIAWSQRQGLSSNPLIQRADALLVLSKRQRNVYIRMGVPPRRVIIAPNFLPQSLVPEPGVRHSSARGWLVIGRVTREKGVIDLVRHWPADEKLTIIGEGDALPDIEKLSAGKHILLLGSVSRDEVLRHIQEALAITFPSKAEVLPLAYLEALAAGVPVVALKNTALADLVQEDKSGLSFRDLASLTRWVGVGHNSFAGCPHDLRRTFDAVYSEAAYIKRTTALYRRLIGACGRHP